MRTSALLFVILTLASCKHGQKSAPTADPAWDTEAKVYQLRFERGLEKFADVEVEGDWVCRHRQTLGLGSSNAKLQELFRAEWVARGKDSEDQGLSFTITRKSSDLFITGRESSIVDPDDKVSRNEKGQLFIKTERAHQTLEDLSQSVYSFLRVSDPSSRQKFLIIEHSQLANTEPVDGYFTSRVMNLDFKAQIPRSIANPDYAATGYDLCRPDKLEQ